MLTFKEYLQESRWHGLLYHATYNPEFDPKHVPAGTHLGSLQAAMSRARDLHNTYDGRQWNTEDLKIHAFKYKPSGKSVRITDNIEGENDITDHYNELVSRNIIKSLPYNHSSRFFTKEEDDNRFENHVKDELKRKGISHLSYVNRAEAKGSKSHVVYDPENLEHVHSFEQPKFIDRPSVKDPMWGRPMHLLPWEKKGALSRIRKKDADV